MNPHRSREEEPVGVKVKNVFSALIRVQSHWQEIGIQLDMETSELKTIETNYSSSKDRLREMITKRIDRGNLTWELIVEALEDPTVGENVLAEEIRVKYIKPQPAPSVPARANSVPEVPMSTGEGHQNDTANRRPSTPSSTVCHPMSSTPPTPVKVTTPIEPLAAARVPMLHSQPLIIPSITETLLSTMLLANQPPTPSKSTAQQLTKCVTSSNAKNSTVQTPFNTGMGQPAQGASNTRIGQENQHIQPNNPHKIPPNSYSVTAVSGDSIRQAVVSTAVSNSATVAHSSNTAHMTVAQSSSKNTTSPIKTSQPSKIGETRKRPVEASQPAYSKHPKLLNKYYDEGMFAQKSSLSKYRCIHCTKIPKTFYRCPCGLKTDDKQGTEKKKKMRFEGNTGLSCTECTHKPCTSCQGRQYKQNRHTAENLRKLAVICPQNCGENLKLYQLDDHTQTNCLNQERPCKYDWAGCTKMGIPKEIKSHEEDKLEHFDGVVSTLRQRIETLENALATLQNQRSQSLSREQLSSIPEPHQP